MRLRNNLTAIESYNLFCFVKTGWYFNVVTHVYSRLFAVSEMRLDADLFPVGGGELGAIETNPESFRLTSASAAPTRGLGHKHLENRLVLAAFPAVRVPFALLHKRRGRGT